MITPRMTRWLARGIQVLRRVRRGPGHQGSRHGTDRHGGTLRPGTESRKQENAPDRVELIGLDVWQPLTRPRSSSIGAILAAILAGALFLVVLRTELLHLRYAVADAVAEEQKLSEQKRSLTVAMRQLRDPGLLNRRARELGFGQPERVIELSADPSLRPASRRPERLAKASGVAATAAASVDARP
jgi:hypothetical protein